MSPPPRVIHTRGGFKHGNMNETGIEIRSKERYTVNRSRVCGLGKQYGDEDGLFYSMAMFLW